MSMNIKTLLKSVKGRRHEFEGKGNQDIIRNYEDDSVLCIVVNDGCSGCEYPETAAEISADIALKTAKNPLIWSMTEKRFKQYMVNEYNRAFCESGLPYEELCSTSAFLIIGKKTNSFIAFSVGDCTVLSYDCMLNVKPLIEPQNGLTKNMTFFTNTDAFILRKVAQFRRGTVKDSGVSGFVIYSDGAESLMEQSFEPVQQLICANLISEKTGSEHIDGLFSSLADMSADDISVAVVSVMTEKVQKAAYATYSGRIAVEKSEENPKKAIEIDIPVDNEPTIKIIPEADKTTEISKPEEKDNENTDNSLITFLAVSRTFDSILNAGIVKPQQLIPILYELMKSEIITCDSKGRFIKI